MNQAKFTGVPMVEDSVPIVPVATAVDASGYDGLFVPTASKVDTKGDEHGDDHDDGVTITWEKGEVQPSAYRDKWFAVAFITHLVAVMGSAAAFGSAGWSKIASNGTDEYASDQDDESDPWGSTSDSHNASQDVPPKEFWFAIIAISMVVAPALSLVAMTIMSRNAIGLIKASLWFSVVLCGMSALLLLSAAPIAGIIYGVFTVLLIWYARSVQSRIPYAASNLKCAITVLKTNLGLGLVSIGSMVGLIAYSLTWIWALIGTMQLDSMKDGGEYNWDESSVNKSDDSDVSALGGIVAFFFLLSFYWTHQVLKNIVRVTVSGVVGTWWFCPAEASSFFSQSIGHSLIRSTTYSLGSICFGSLIVAILQMARQALHRAQNDRNAGILRCIAMCILSYIERIVEYFNKWAYVYVGLYGYGYIDAGKRVINLFKTRGWQTIIADNLVNRLLGIMALTIGLLTGVCTLFAAFVVEEFESQNGWMPYGFVVGFFVGLTLSCIFMGLLSSAVDAIIVLFAEAPAELMDSHPMIAQEMSQTWSDAWGEGICGPVIIGLGGGLGVV